MTDVNYKYFTGSMKHRSALPCWMTRIPVLDWDRRTFHALDPNVTRTFFSVWSVELAPPPLWQAVRCSASASLWSRSPGTRHWSYLRAGGDASCGRDRGCQGWETFTVADALCSRNRPPAQGWIAIDFGVLPEQQDEWGLAVLNVVSAHLLLLKNCWGIAHPITAWASPAPFSPL